MFIDSADNYEFHMKLIPYYQGTPGAESNILYNIWTPKATPPGKHTLTSREKGGGRKERKR